MDEICGCLWGSWMMFFFCFFFTVSDSLKGIRVQACLRRAGSEASGMAFRYRITHRLPEA